MALPLRLMGAAGGALGGALIAPEDRKMQGAVMGGGLGLAAGHGLSSVGKALGGAAKAAAVQALHAYEEKHAFEGNIGGSIPGTPIGFSMKHPSERLKGMQRWVPRQAIETAYAGEAAGLPEQEILDQAAQSGQLEDPAMGAMAGAAFGAWKSKNQRILGAALGAILGGSAGSVYNTATRDTRRADTAEALKGVRQERASQPAPQFEPSAIEPQPKILSTGGVG